MGGRFPGCEKTINIVDDQWNNPTWTEALADVIERVIDKRLLGNTPLRG